MFNRGEPPWPVRREVFRRGIAEYGNFRIALETSLAHGDAEAGLRLCIGLRNMWVPHGDAREAATWLDRFLCSPGDPARCPPQVRGRALAVRAEIAFDLQDYDTLVRCATESLELARAGGDDFPVPTALRVMSQAAARAGGPARRWPGSTKPSRRPRRRATTGRPGSRWPPGPPSPSGRTS